MTDQEQDKAINPGNNQPSEQPGRTTIAEPPREEELGAQLEEARRQAEQYKDLFLRKAAEDLISEILPVLDDFERSLNLSKERKDFESFYRGVELIYQKLLKILESQGIKAVETVGKPFDVHYHDALMQEPREDVPPFTILKEVEKGYTFHDKVIRHAKVVVSSSAAQPAQIESSSIPPTQQQNFAGQAPEK
jgi:molecular chaperone GrpE (heat shock protein)